MSRKNSTKTDARLLQKTYGIYYTTALRLVREKGLDLAIEQCEKWKQETDDALLEGDLL